MYIAHFLGASQPQHYIDQLVDLEVFYNIKVIFLNASLMRQSMRIHMKIPDWVRVPPRSEKETDCEFQI
jgi:hypothetical protein